MKVLQTVAVFPGDKSPYRTQITVAVQNFTKPFVLFETVINLSQYLCGT